MSFGKDSKHLEGMPVYGGSSAQRAANAGRRTARGSSSKRPYWIDAFKPSESNPAAIRIIPGEYMTQRVNEQSQLVTEKTEWFEYIEHYSGVHRRGGICSGGPWFFDRNKRETCYGCDRRDNEPRGKKSISRSDKFAYVVIDMGVFHKVQQIDNQTGRVRVNVKTNEPYTTWTKCIGRGCQSCHVAMESRYGYIQSWPMSKAHFNSLNSWAPRIATCCVACGGRGTITSTNWHCGNPQCRQVIFDMNTTTATEEQITATVNQPYPCRQCKQSYYLEEDVMCSGCAVKGTQPVRATIYDVDLQVQAVRTGENDNTILTIVGMTDPKPIDPVFQDLLQYKPDLSKRFAPSTLEEQSRQWGAPAVQNQPVGSPPPPQSHVQSYGQAPIQQPLKASFMPPQYAPPAPIYTNPAANQLGQVQGAQGVPTQINMPYTSEE